MTMPELKYWLVEEHTLEWSKDEETVTFHVVVEASTPQFAFNEANNISVKTRIRTWNTETSREHSEPVEFAFSADELEEAVPGYLWGAADGSSIAYEVRCLGKLEMDCTYGKVAFK
jgi:hypothetical protein